MSKIDMLSEWKIAQEHELSTEELEIIDMLRHYFMYKEYFSQNLFMKSMMYLIRGKNPFLYLKEQFIQEAYKKSNKRYSIGSDVFDYKLKNDL